MAAYYIAQTDVKDAGTFETYRVQVAATLAPFDAEILVRGGAFEVLEGAWPIKRNVVIRFADIETAKAWYNSDAYSKIRPIRQSVSENNIIIIEGA
jgi:uncharacterized protein (DUF1330 family)